MCVCVYAYVCGFYNYFPSFFFFFRFVSLSVFCSFYFSTLVLLLSFIFMFVSRLLVFVRLLPLLLLLLLILLLFSHLRILTNRLSFFDRNHIYTPFAIVSSFHLFVSSVSLQFLSSSSYFLSALFLITFSV